MGPWIGGAVVVLAAATSACISDADLRSAPDTRSATASIIGGKPSSPSAFPATGMLVSSNRLVCTATLIAPDVVLTAAHCLTPPKFGVLWFTLDPDATDGMSNLIEVAYPHQHPEFDSGVDDYLDLAVRNDIGIAILKEPVVGAALEQIADPDMALDGGANLSVCGYGRLVWHVGNQTLKRDAMVVVDRTSAFEFSTTAADPQPCDGDSGAPLFTDGPGGRRIVGVVSRAMGQSDRCDSGAIITRAAPYTAWIDEASQQRTADAGCRATRGGSPALLAALALLLGSRARRLRNHRRSGLHRARTV